MLAALIDGLNRGLSLTSADVHAAVSQLTDAEVSVEQKSDFLTALARKGETAEEIRSFVSELLQRSVAFPLDESVRSRGVLDVCGTGGDHLNTFNISTSVALLAAAGGVFVAKHGNRAITSQSGSADVLEALGIPIDLPASQAAEVLRDHGFVFLMAPLYHPAFKHIAPARRRCADQGQRTIFNFIGPLLNPARPSSQLIGVSRGDLCEPLARVLQSLGVRRGMVVSGSTGTCSMDELSILGDNRIAEFYQDRGFSVSTLSPADLGLLPASLADLAGGDKHRNAELVLNVLSGRDRGPKRDAVLLNSGAALFVAGAVSSIAEGWELGGRWIDEGRVVAKIEALRSVRSRS